MFGINSNTNYLKSLNKKGDTKEPLFNLLEKIMYPKSRTLNKKLIQNVLLYNDK